MKYYWFNKNCCVSDCLNSSTAGPGCNKEYYDLPAEPQARKRWLDAIFIDDAEELKVCEDHFQEEDIFRDKTNRKKLRLNSVPTQKLPEQNICNVCLGAKRTLDWNMDLKPHPCVCLPPTPQPLKTVMSPPNKRTRMSWTQEEKKVIFKGIKGHGDFKKTSRKCRINWTNVISYCRKNGCFGNEKELKICWQNLKANAKKVRSLEIKGTKLERKICKYMFGKTAKKAKNNGIRSKEEATDTPSSEEEDEEANLKMPILTPEESLINTSKEEKVKEDIVKKNGVKENVVKENVVKEDIVKKNGVKQNVVKEDKVKEDTGNEKKEEIEEKEEQQICEKDKMQICEEDEESDEYYSISDVEEKFQIRIRPFECKEIISLLSSDED